MPIDIAAFSYHWSVLKITRRTLFFSGLARERDFLALVADTLEALEVEAFEVEALEVEALEVFEAAPFEGMFFAIGITRFIPTALHLSSGGGAVTVESGAGKKATKPSAPPLIL